MKNIKYGTMKLIDAWNFGILLMVVTYSTTNAAESHSQSQTTTTSTFPPLIHNLQPNAPTQSPPGSSLSDRASHPSTHPPLIHNPQYASTTTSPIVFLNGKGPAFGIEVTDKREISTHPPLIHTMKGDSPTRGGKSQNGGVQTVSQLVNSSRCPWAIVRCCKDTAVLNPSTRSCLESLGCPGPYWSADPCSGVFVDAAIRNAFTQHTTDKTK